MRHMKKGRQLNRSASHRRALMSNLITSLILKEKIRTTTAKAKEARPLAEKIITYAKRGDLHARRQVLRLIKDKEAVSKLFDTLGERFKERPGGYTRILKLANRNGDNAEMALLELVSEEVSKGSGRKRRRRSKKKAGTEAQPQARQTGEQQEQPAAEETPAADDSAAAEENAAAPEAAEEAAAGAPAEEAEAAADADTGEETPEAEAATEAPAGEKVEEEAKAGGEQDQPAEEEKKEE